MTDLIPELPQSDECIYSAGDAGTSSGILACRSLSRFDYNRLDAESRTLAQLRAEEIKILMKQTAQNIIAIGQKLQEMKECLGHGQFGKWLRAEFEWGIATAARFMQVAASFGDDQIYQIDKFAPSALYLLAAPSTPDAARTAALERAAQGESITHKAAKQIVAEVKKTASFKRKPAQSTESAQPVEPTEPTEPPVRLPKEISTCNWNKDRGQERFMQVNLYDQSAGMKLERLAKEQDKLPITIVELGLDALEVLPEREKKITELILKLQDSAKETKTLESKVAELSQALESKVAEFSQALAMKDAKLAELEQTMRLTPQDWAQKDSKLAELEQVIAQKDSKLAELEQAMRLASPLRSAQKDSNLAELEEQLTDSEHYSTQASLKLEELEKELAQANQLIEQQQPKILPSGKPQPVPRTPTPNLKSLIDFFDTAAEKLQKPSVQISINDKTIVVSRNSTQHPGALNIKAGGAWQGRIEPNGNLYKIWEWDEWVMPMLLEFAANPAEMAAQHGRSSGSCCFCKHELRDERSLATGYGATCAQHYGLQWPLENKLAASASTSCTD